MRNRGQILANAGFEKQQPTERALCALLALAIAAALVLGGVPAPGSAAAGIVVPLEVRNDLAIARAAEPVTTGIPVPRDLDITDAANLSITDDSGNPVPCQFEVTARWGGGVNDAGKPIRWILATFLADVGANITSTYNLTDSPNATVTDLHIDSDDGNGVVIDTGAASFTVSRLKGTMLERVEVGGTVVTDSAANGIVLTLPDGTVLSSSAVAPRAVTVLESGPVRTAIKVEGDLGSGVPAQTDYEEYMYFYAGKSYVRLLHTQGNHDTLKLLPDYGGWYVYDYGDPGSITFSELRIRHDLRGPTGTPTYLLPSQEGDLAGSVDDLSVLQDSSGTDYWDRYNDTPYTDSYDGTYFPNGDHPRPNSYQESRGYRATNGGAVVDSGDRHPGWVDISDDDKGITMGVKDFWQNFPKGITADAAGVTAVGLFPADGNYHDGYNLRVGDEKTHEAFFFFHAGNGSAAGSADTAQCLLSPMLALAPAEDFKASGAVGEFTIPTETLEARRGQYWPRPGQLNDNQAYDYYNDRTLEEDPTPNPEYWSYSPCMSLVKGATKPASREYFNMYGWAFYGNQPLEEEQTDTGKCAFFDNKYDFDFGAWLQFIRTQDGRWRYLAESFSRHLESIMMHDTELENGWNPAQYHDCVFGHSTHNERGNSNGVRNHHGNTPQFVWGARGSALHYYLTGYPPSGEFISSVAEYMYQKWSMDSLVPGLYDGGYEHDGTTRTAANTLNVLVEGWRFTGDDKYRQMARDLMDLYVPEEQVYINGPVEGNTMNVPIMFLGHYLCAMARYAETAEEYGLTQEASTAKERLVRFVDFMIEYTTYRYGRWLCSPARWEINGDNPQGQITPAPNNPDGWNVSNWNLVYADACAYAYAFAESNRTTYLDFAREYFTTGVNVPYCADMEYKLLYTSTKEATNHAVHGSIYMYYSALDEGLPEIVSITPSRATNDGTATITNLAGTGFQAGATVKLARDGHADIDAEGVTVESATRITCSFDLRNKATGKWNVVVTNPEGKSATHDDPGFTVDPAQPVDSVPVPPVTPSPAPEPQPPVTTSPDPEPAPPPPRDPVYPVWYLAEGSSDWGFETYVTIVNPNDTEVTAHITYMTKSGPRDMEDLALPALSQVVVNPRDFLGATDFSTRVECREGKTIAVDRRMTWKGGGTASPAGHSSIGATAPAKTWYLPEGSSSWGFECWLLIQNPGASDATCNVTYMLEDGKPETVVHRVGAGSRSSISMEGDIGNRDASIKVDSDAPVIAERAMYRNDRREGHNSIGTTAPANDYYLAEGSSAWGFITYILVQNPNADPAVVTVTYMTDGGPRVQEPFTLGAYSRQTIKVNSVMPELDFSTAVHADRPIIAERAVYWGSGTALGEACHDSIGMPQAHTTFYLPDGETTNGHETWTLVQNPNDQEVEIEVSYLTPSGKGNVVFADRVSANSRKTYNMAEAIPSGRAAVMVRSKTPGRKIMVERAMYWNSRGAGTDTIGGYSD